MDQEVTSSAIRGFSKYVYRALGAQAVVCLCVALLIAACPFCFLYGMDFAVALCLAGSIILGFLYFLIGLHIQENVLRKALRAKQALLAAQLAGQTDDGFEEAASAVLQLARPKSPSLLVNRLIWWLAWPSFHTLSEVFFLAAIDRAILRIKATPAELEHHAALANRYVVLSNHYREPIRLNKLLPWPGLRLTSSMAQSLESKARASASNAVEELSILKAFAPDQPWVHDQLAISYRELGLPEEEIKAYEAIIMLCQDDPQALLRLGILYFQQGRSAKGLELYEKLLPIQAQLAEELIGHYGAYAPYLTQ